MASSAASETLRSTSTTIAKPLRGRTFLRTRPQAEQVRARQQRRPARGCRDPGFAPRQRTGTDKIFDRLDRRSGVGKEGRRGDKLDLAKRGPTPSGARGGFGLANRKAHWALADSPHPGVDDIELALARGLRHPLDFVGDARFPAPQIDGWRLGAQQSIED